MTTEQLKERIEKATERLEKKKATVEKKAALILKKEKAIEKSSDDHEILWLKYDIELLQNDLKRLPKEIAEIEKTIENYNEQLNKENDYEVKIQSMPECFKELQSILVNRWNEYDFKRRDELIKAYKEMDFRDFYQKYHCRRDSFDKTDEQIDKENKRDAKMLLLDLLRRVDAICGKVTSYANVRLEQGAHGMAVLNGTVTGTNGKCRIESILAGGYNIQRLHIRVLTHEIN